MKVCIVGAGAIGGLLGVRLAGAGIRVSVLARGATLAALREHGWRLQAADGLRAVSVEASEDPAALGPQDLVVIAVKAPSLGSLAARIAPLLGPDTVVMPAMNGVPWWFCDRVPGLDIGPLESVDPGGAIAHAIPFERVLGCVVHASATHPDPGLVHHRMGQGLIIGEPAGGRSARAQAIADLFLRAGFDVTLSASIREDIWYKLWGNLTMNPVSAITGATADRLLADPLVRDFCSQVMREAAAIGARIACPITQTPEDRHAVTEKLGAFKTSMLQDVEAGRQIELDAIVAVVSEIGHRVGLPTQGIDTLLGITRLFGRVRGVYPAG